MLDFVPSPDTRPRSMLSLDFSPYLLSASPPSSGFSLDSLSLTSNYSPYSFFSSPPSRPSSAYTKVYGPSYVCEAPPLKSIMSANSKDGQLSNKTSKDDQLSKKISKEDQASNKTGKDDQAEDETGKDHRAENETLKEDCDLDRTSPCSSTEIDLSSSSSAVRRYRADRHVSFADDMGRPLAEVRMVLDNPTAPPVLSFRGVPGESRPGSVLNGNNRQSRLVLVAPDLQPLARANFEHDLCRNLLAVENVITDNYDLTCTVLVSTRPSSKHVFGRYTMDSWRTFHDVQASFTSLARPGYDRFQFVLTIPSSSADPAHPIQFAVCLEADGVQYWDNNDGNDFVLHWERQAELEDCSFEDYNTNSMNYSGFDWYSHDGLDRPYY